MRRGRTAWLLNLDCSNVTALPPALRTAQSFLKIRERHVPSTEVCQQIWIGTPLVSASGALDHQKVLSKLIGKTLNLEIARHERYCIYQQPPIATIFTAQTAFEHDDWTRKGLSVLQQSRLPIVRACGRSWGHGLWQLGAVAGRPNRGSQPLQRRVSVRPVRTRMASGVSHRSGKGGLGSFEQGLLGQRVHPELLRRLFGLARVFAIATSEVSTPARSRSSSCPTHTLTLTADAARRLRAVLG